MAHLHIIDTAAHTFGATGSNIPSMIIVVNTGFTGTITTTDANGTVGVATNPVIGNSFRYFDLQGVVTVTNSAAGDTTVNTISGYSHS